MWFVLHLPLMRNILYALYGRLLYHLIFKKRSSPRNSTQLIDFAEFLYSEPSTIVRPLIGNLFTVVSRDRWIRDKGWIQIASFDYFFFFFFAVGRIYQSKSWRYRQCRRIANCHVIPLTYIFLLVIVHVLLDFRLENLRNR